MYSRVFRSTRSGSCRWKCFEYWKLSLTRWNVSKFLVWRLTPLLQSSSSRLSLAFYQVSLFCSDKVLTASSSRWRLQSPVGFTSPSFSRSLLHPVHLSPTVLPPALLLPVLLRQYIIRVDTKLHIHSFSSRLVSFSSFRFIFIPYQHVLHLLFSFHDLWHISAAFGGWLRNYNKPGLLRFSFFSSFYCISCNNASSVSCNDCAACPILAAVSLAWAAFALICSRRSPVAYPWIRSSCFKPAILLCCLVTFRLEFVVPPVHFIAFCIGNTESSSRFCQAGSSHQQPLIESSQLVSGSFHRTYVSAASAGSSSSRRCWRTFAVSEGSRVLLCRARATSIGQLLYFPFCVF